MFFFSLNKLPILLLVCLLCGPQAVIAKSTNPSHLHSEKETEFRNTVLSPLLILGAPANVKARPSLVGALTVNWDAVPGAIKYRIEFANSPTGAFKELATVNEPTLSYRHTGLSYDQTVYYRVSASDGSTASEFSNTASGKTFSKGHVFRILPLGDSNTKGSNSKLPEAPQNEPYQYAYRKKLYQLLLGASVPFDFIGSEYSGTASNEFADYDHAGFGGARIRDIADLLRSGTFEYYNSGVMRGPGGGPYLDKYNPDIILLHIGTNWVFNDQATVDKLNEVLELVDAYEARANKEVTVVLARIIKRCQDCPDRPSDAAQQDEYTRVFNERLWQLAAERIAKGDRLIRVDMETGAGLSYSKNGSDMLDYLHLTDAGYTKMAQVWFNALKNDLTVIPPPLDTEAPETSIVLKPDPVTNKKTATFSFSSNETGVVYQLSWNGAPFATTTNPVTFQDLSDGTYSIAVRAIDANENVDPTPATYTWIVDTQPPASPVIAVPVNNALLNNNRPQFSGSAEPSSQVSIIVNGNVIGTTTTDAQGNWNMIATTALAEGKHQVSGTATDAAGNTSVVSSQLTFTIDTIPPAVPVLVAITEDTGSKNNDQITNDRTLRFSGLAEEGSVVTLSEISLGTIGTATATNTGKWEVNFENTALAEKVHTFRAVAKDAAGNTSPASSNFSVHVDVTAPIGYAIQFNTAKVDLGNMKNIGLQVTGAEVGATYTYSIASNNGGTPVAGSAIITTTGFTITGLDVSGLQDGELIASFYLEDAAGNRGNAVTAKIEKITKDIVAVKALGTIKVPFKTTFADVPLPAQLEVTYSDNTKEMVSVTWQQGTYNGERPGIYTLNGVLQLKPNTSNSANKAGLVTVEVEPNKAPTALALSDLVFKPNIASTEVIGTFTTTDPDDKLHTYTLVTGAGDTHNNLFEIKEDKLYLISNKGLSGSTDFMIRVRSTDAYNNSIEKAFILKKEPFKGKIKVANAFTPDGDGINDKWVLPELRFFDEVDIQIFDRTGARLFHSNNPENGWDGRNLKGDVQEGAYFYILTVKDIGLVQKGVVTVIR